MLIFFEKFQNLILILFERTFSNILPLFEKKCLITLDIRYVDAEKHGFSLKSYNINGRIIDDR
jgi:hypothetical protein